MLVSVIFYKFTVPNGDLCTIFKGYRTVQLSSGRPFLRNCFRA